jgi:hypothetical protein
MREIVNFPIGLERIGEKGKQRLSDLSHKLMTDLKKNKERKEAQYQATGAVAYDEFYPKYSKPIIDAIDRELGAHYGLSEEELDFIINYDIKYRMGRSDEDEE